MLYDLYHYYGGDLAIDSTGDLALSSGVEYSQQRVLRRLLTNQGDYIFHQNYGAGVPAKVGQTIDVAKIRGLIRGQMLLEESVEKNPEPQVSVSEINGGVAVRIQYVEAQTKQSTFLSFDAAQ